MKASRNAECSEMRGLPVTQAPMFQKLFSPTVIEVVFQSSVVNVIGLKAGIHIDGVRKNLVVTLPRRRLL